MFIKPPIKNSTFSDSKKTISWYLLAGVGIIVWLLLKAPTPEFFLIGADGGHQITGATQILTMGEHPYLDFYETYGPLTFYSSALAQLLSGVRPIGEIALLFFGHFLGYISLFWLLLRMCKNILAALVILSLALVLLPQYYKYYCVFIPFLSMAVVYLHVYRETRFTFWMLAAVVAVASLYRHDFGIYTLLMALVAICSDQKISGIRRLHKCIGFMLSVLLLLLPWLVFLLMKQGLGTYIALIFYSSMAMSKGLSLPHPLLHWGNIYLTLIYLFIFMLPLAALFYLLMNCKWMEQNEKRFLMATSTLAVVSLVQSSHRADFYHLLEGSPPAYVCLAILARQIAKSCKISVMIPTALLACLLIGLAVKASPYNMFPGSSSRMVARKLSYFMETRQVFIDRLVQENNRFWPAKAVQQIRDQTDAGERVAIYPFHVKFNYFAMRPFAGGLMLLAPGYFDSDSYLNKAVATMEKQKVRYVLWNEQFAFDGLQERNPVNSASLLFQQIRQRYIKAGKLYGFTVYRRIEEV